MSESLENTIILAVVFLLLFGSAEVFYHMFKVKVELTRKYVHIGTGIITLFFPVLIGNHWLILALCGSFAVILLTSLRFNLLQSINAIDRDSMGSILYPAVVYTVYLIYLLYGNGLYIYFYLPILTLAICDPLAAGVGRRWPKGKYTIGTETKTVMGSSAFFISSLILTVILLHYMADLNLGNTIVVAVVIGLIATVTEGASRRGFDNLFIPLVVLGCLVGFTELQGLF